MREAVKVLYCTGARLVKFCQFAKVSPTKDHMLSDLDNQLNPEQSDAVKTIEGPLLIIAGAGSGKTRVITYRIANILAHGIPQSAILALTFTNKAAREMQERVVALTRKKLQQLNVSTFHAFGVQILKKHAKKLGFRDNFSIYDTSDQLSLIKESARSAGLYSDELDYNRLISNFSRIKTKRTNWKELDDPHAQKIYAEYQSHLLLYNAVDFDDLITLPTILFEKHPDVLLTYREQYRYILVDEFQDTSLGQYEFMKQIALGSRNICVVGDDDQSIYSWRGANFENIQNFEKDFSELKEIRLEQNYRSTGTILEAANNVIANNKNRKIKALWTPAGSGNLVELYHLGTETEEAEFIADTIKEICLRESLTYDDVGVLIRTNSLARHIEESFMAKNLPYRLSGGTSFFQRPEIKDMISYLRIICNPDDDVSFLRIINTPKRGVGKKSIEALTGLAMTHQSSLYGALLDLKKMGQEAALLRYRESGPSLFEAFEDTPIDLLAGQSESGMSKLAYQSLMDFSDLIDTYRPKFLSGKKMADTLRLMVHEIDYWPHLVQEFQNNEKIAKWRFHNVEIFCSSLEQYEKNPDNHPTSVFTYLNRVSLQNHDEQEDDQIKGKVNLMTIHASKGLEFKVVFLAGVEDGIIPHKRSLMENEEGDYDSNMEEERRLFYVAITRAQQKLIMTSCRQRTVMRQTVDSALSPFLQEISAHLIESKVPEQKIAEEDLAVDFFAKLKSQFPKETDNAAT